MQFSTLIQSSILVAMASMAVATSQIPQCVSCDDSGTCAFSTDYEPVEAAVKASSPAKGWTLTYENCKNKMTVSFSDKKSSQILLQDDSGVEGVAFIQFDMKATNPDEGRYAVSYKVPANGKCLFSYPVGYCYKEVAEINTYLKKSQ